MIEPEYKRRIFSCTHCGKQFETKNDDPHFLPNGWARVKYDKRGLTLLACSLACAQAEIKKRKIAKYETER